MISKHAVHILIVTLTYILLPYRSSTQCDYTTSRFGVRIEKGVHYGIAEQFDGQMDTLYLDIYKPVGDKNTQRPLIIWCFGGGFFTGDRDDFADLAVEMASRGYVAVTIDYRLGYVHPDALPYPFAYDDMELLRAAYRAMQDAKGAIRFMKNRHVMDSTDISEVYIGGASAGSITALAAVFLRNKKDIDSTLVGGLPSTMTTPPVERPDLGPVEGELNLGGEDASVAGVVNIFGALFDTDQIKDDDSLAVYSYHQSMDPVVPCDRDKAYWGFPGIRDNMPYGSGGCAIDDRLNEIGYEEDLYKTWIYDGASHAIHNNTLVFGDIIEFLDLQICREATSVSDVVSEDWTIVPNPADDAIKISGARPEGEFQLRDLNGRVLRIFRGSDGRVDISGLVPGCYLLSRKGSGEIKRLVKH